LVFSRPAQKAQTDSACGSELVEAGLALCVSREEREEVEIEWASALEIEEDWASGRSEYGSALRNP
jgi:hypothetical protein